MSYKGTCIDKMCRCGGRQDNNGRMWRGVAMMGGCGSDERQW